MPPMGRKRLRPRSITYKQILPLNSLHLLLKRLHPDSIPITNERYLIGKPNYFRVSDKVSEYFQLKLPKNASLKNEENDFLGISDIQNFFTLFLLFLAKSLLPNTCRFGNGGLQRLLQEVVRVENCKICPWLLQDLRCASD